MGDQGPLNDPRHIPVFGRQGRLGWVEPSGAAGETPDMNNPYDGENDQTDAVQEDAVQEDNILVRLENGTLIQVPADLLVEQRDGSYFLPMSADQFEGASADRAAEPAGQAQDRRRMVVPVIVEEAQVGKRRTTRTVRVHKTVSQHEQVVDQPGFQEEVNVERVPVNQFVESAPKARYENNTLVIPVLEEVLVVEKRLMLKEEVRITRQRRTTRSPQRVTLRSEHVEVERSPDEQTVDSLQDLPSDQIQGNQNEGRIE